MDYHRLVRFCLAMQNADEAMRMALLHTEQNNPGRAANADPFSPMA
jgi:hypothetical protein